MIDPVGSDISKNGDTFMASLGDAVVVNGKTVLEKGTKVRGRVSNVDPGGRVKGTASVELVLVEVIAKDKTYAIDTQPFVGSAPDSKKTDAVKIGGGAGLGAIIGGIAGGKKGAAIGAAVGGGAGTAAVLATRGKDVRLESEAKVNFILNKPVDVTLTKGST